MKQSARQLIIPLLACVLGACAPGVTPIPSVTPPPSTALTNTSSATPTITPSQSATFTASPSSTATPTITPSATPTSTMIILSTWTPTEQPEEEATPKPKRTRTPTAELQSSFVPDLGELLRGPVYLEGVQVSAPANEPGTAVLHLTGNLPTPCNELKVIINGPDSLNQFAAEVYSLSWSNRTCIQVLAPFETEITLATGLPPRDYSVIINGGDPMPFTIQAMEITQQEEPAP